jgi:hypothetical protein
MFGASECIVSLWCLPVALFIIVPLALLVVHMVAKTLRSVVTAISGKVTLTSGTVHR